MRWLPEPEPGTPVCGGFDGSSVDDATAIKLRTIDGMIFTPRLGVDDRPTIWLPAEHNGTVPRAEIHAAWARIFDRFDVRLVYCDPPGYQSEIETWQSLYGGDKVVVEWPTYSPKRMHAALERFHTDLSTGAISHDGCPVTTLHMNNARKVARGNETYILNKPANSQKIDAAMASVLAHEAGCDALASGWTTEPVDSRMIVLD